MAPGPSAARPVEAGSEAGEAAVGSRAEDPRAPVDFRRGDLPAGTTTTMTTTAATAAADVLAANRPGGTTPR
ncbi:MAG: hypothetical protein L3K03_05585 [Thermoplasmata archaeon]|nr:hypothetical protein [Thermoplasmata archaeon]